MFAGIWIVYHSTRHIKWLKMKALFYFFIIIKEGDKWSGGLCTCRRSNSLALTLVEFFFNSLRYHPTLLCRIILALFF